MNAKIICFFFLMASLPVLAQFQQHDRPQLIFNPPYSSNNRSIILPSDRIPNDFLGCSVGSTSEVDALKNINKVVLKYSN